MRREPLLPLFLGLAFWGLLLWCAVRAFAAPTPVPPKRRCTPLIIGTVECGKICRLADKWSIRGCKPLNRLMRDL